jgi:hypothetical protein
MFNKSRGDWTGHIFTLGGVDYFIDKVEETKTGDGASVSCTAIDKKALGIWGRIVLRFWKVVQWRLYAMHQRCRESQRLLMSIPAHHNCRCNMSEESDGHDED